MAEITPGVAVIDEATLERARKVVKHAEVHRISLSDIVRRMDKKAAVGDDPNFVVTFPQGWKVVYSVEQQPEPFGWVKHISASWAPDGKPTLPPASVVVRIILHLFQLHDHSIVHAYVEHNFAPNLLLKPTPKNEYIPN